MSTATSIHPKPSGCGCAPNNAMARCPEARRLLAADDMLREELRRTEDRGPIRDAIAANEDVYRAHMLRAMGQA